MRFEEVFLCVLRDFLVHFERFFDAVRDFFAAFGMSKNRPVFELFSKIAENEMFLCGDCQKKLEYRGS